MLKVAFLVLVLALSPGCGSFSPERVELSPDQVARVAAVVGKDLDAESIRSAAAKAFEVEVDNVELKISELTGKLEAVTLTLPAIAKEAAGVGGKAALDRVAENPTTSGIIAGGGAALAAVIALLAKRSRLRREAKSV